MFHPRDVEFKEGERVAGIYGEISQKCVEVVWEDLGGTAYTSIFGGAHVR
jgi:hypothetical protein